MVNFKIIFFTRFKIRGDPGVDSLFGAVSPQRGKEVNERVPTAVNTVGALSAKKTAH